MYSSTQLTISFGWGCLFPRGTLRRTYTIYLMCCFGFSCGWTSQEYIWGPQVPLTFVYALLSFLTYKYFRLWWFQALSYLLISFPWGPLFQASRRCSCPSGSHGPCPGLLWYPNILRSFFLNISTFWFACLFLCQKQHKGKFILAHSLREHSPPRQRWSLAGPWDNWTYCIHSEEIKSNDNRASSDFFPFIWSSIPVGECH